MTDTWFSVHLIYFSYVISIHFQVIRAYAFMKLYSNMKCLNLVMILNENQISAYDLDVSSSFFSLFWFFCVYLPNLMLHYQTGWKSLQTKKLNK